jgi:hypothetical protein
VPVIANLLGTEIAVFIICGVIGSIFYSIFGARIEKTVPLLARKLLAFLGFYPK